MRTGERSVRRGAGTECGTLGDATGVGCVTVGVALVIAGFCCGVADAKISASW